MDLERYNQVTLSRMFYRILKGLSANIQYTSQLFYNKIDYAIVMFQYRQTINAPSLHNPIIEYSIFEERMLNKHRYCQSATEATL